MFKKNDSHGQLGLFDVTDQLSPHQQNLLSTSLEGRFYDEIFCKIDESRFGVLYSSIKSRPNVAVNQLVGALILKHLYNWTYEQLFLQLNFNLLTRWALGIRSLETAIFCPSSIFNFQRRLFEHYVQSGQHLIEEVFDQLTAAQLKSLGIKSSIQRCDSFQAGSNIFAYPRLQLLIEVLLRLSRQLDKPALAACEELLAPYLGQTSGQYTFRLSKEEIQAELGKIGQVYHQLYQQLKPAYEHHQIFVLFCRVYQEHFVFEDQQIILIPSKELATSTLLSPDDPEATYRKKAGKDHKGYVTHICETAHPDNELNLITDVATHPNNTDDGAILAQQAPSMLTKTPDLEELHTDGGYPSPAVDELLVLAGVTLFATNQRGRKARVVFKEELQPPLKPGEVETYLITCPRGQAVSINPSGEKKAATAYFDAKICQSCPFLRKCSTKEHKKKNLRSRYYEYVDFLRIKRRERAKKVPKERKKLRANVEASVRQMKRGIKNGKLRVRGFIQAQTYAFFTAISVNFKRIHHEKERKRGKESLPKAKKDMILTPYAYWQQAA